MGVVLQDEECLESGRRGRLSTFQNRGVMEKTSMYLCIQLLRCEKRFLGSESSRVEDAVAFRNKMIVNGRGFTKDQKSFLFVPMLSNGNCGFLTIAIGANKVLKRNYSSYDIRKTLCNEVRGNRAFYLNEAMKNPAHRYQMEDEIDFGLFERSVLKTGWNGHWLGEKWGMLEIKSLARALGVTIEVFCHDSKSNSLRSYHQEKYGDKFVGMFFSGLSSKGHFDLLLHDPKSLS